MKKKKNKSKSTPVDVKMYNKIKKKIYVRIPKHSAYRSGILVKEYKKEFKRIYGKKSPYTGKKTRKRGLKRWFLEDWRNQRGEIGYKYKNDIYRPMKRINKHSPLTHYELNKNEIKKARRIKYKKGRITRFRKKNKTKKKKWKKKWNKK